MCDNDVDMRSIHIEHSVNCWRKLSMRRRK